MKQVFQAALDDLEMLERFSQDRTAIDFGYRTGPEFAALDAALDNPPEPPQTASSSRMLPGGR